MRTVVDTMDTILFKGAVIDYREGGGGAASQVVSLQRGAGGGKGY